MISDHVAERVAATQRGQVFGQVLTDTKAASRPGEHHRPDGPIGADLIDGGQQIVLEGHRERVQGGGPVQRQQGHAGGMFD